MQVRVERFWQLNYLQLRPWTFFNASIHAPPPGAAPFNLATDATTVTWSDDATLDGAKARAASDAGRAAPAALELPPGLSDKQLLDVMRSSGAGGARVLHLASAENVFGGFEGKEAASEFDRMIMQWLLGGWSATWCCTSWDKMRGTYLFKRPLRLATGAQAQWQPGRGPRPPEIPEKRACYAAACRDARE